MIRLTKHLIAIAFSASIAVALCAEITWAQGSRKDDIVFNAQGRPMAGATVRVCTSAATGQPCAPLAPVYSDAALTQALANPLATDGLGNYSFYAAPGRYMIELSGPGIMTKQISNVILPSDPSSPTFTSVTTTSGISAFSLSLSGNLTVSGSSAVTGALTAGGITSTGPDTLSCVQQISGRRIVGCGANTTIQAAITAAGSNGYVEIPSTYAGTDSFTNPNKIPVLDYRLPAWRGYLYASDFGCVGDGVTDNTSCLNQMIAYSEANASTKIVFPCGQFSFASKPNPFGTGIIVEGCATGSTTSSGTFLEANYTESTCSSATSCNGFLTWDGSYGTAKGTGGGLRNATIYRPSNNTGGAAIKLTGADDNHRAGFWRGDHISVTSAVTPAGTWSYDWLVDGHNNTTAGTQGIRDIMCTDCWFTSTTVADSSIYMVNCAKCSWIGGEVYQGAGGAGSAGATVTGTGGAGANSSNSAEVTLMGTFSGDAYVDQASGIRIVSAHVTGDATFTSNASKSSLIGRVEGTPSNSSTTSVMLVDGVGSVGPSYSNVGGSMGALASGQTPPTGTAGALYSTTGATAGVMYYGDGSCFNNMISALTFGFTCGNGATYAFNGTGSQVKSPIFNPSSAYQVNGTLLASATAPTISSGFGTSPSIATSNGTASFTVNVGTGGTASSGVIGLPAAASGWNCTAFDATNPTTGGGYYVKQTAGTTTTATLTGYNTAGAATAWPASDVLSVSCFAR